MARDLPKTEVSRILLAFISNYPRRDSFFLNKFINVNLYFKTQLNFINAI